MSRILEKVRVWVGKLFFEQREQEQRPQGGSMPGVTEDHQGSHYSYCTKSKGETGEK